MQFESLPESSLLPKSADVIMIGEIRDKETADIAMQASMTGHLVLSTLHTNDTASSQDHKRLCRDAHRRYQLRRAAHQPLELFLRRAELDRQLRQPPRILEPPLHRRAAARQQQAPRGQRQAGDDATQKLGLAVGQRRNRCQPQGQLRLHLPGAEQHLCKQLAQLVQHAGRRARRQRTDESQAAGGGATPEGGFGQV